MAYLQDFIDRVRTLLDMPPAGPLLVAGSEPDDPHKCVLACILGLPVLDVPTGDPRVPAWDFAIRFENPARRNRDGPRMACQPAAVKLPDELIDLMVADHFGKVEADDMGFLRGWWVPTDRGEATDRHWRFFTPNDPHLVPNGPWHLPQAVR